jgi:hypothetical protein
MAETLFILILGTFYVEEGAGVTSLGSFTSQEACRAEMNARAIYWLGEFTDMTIMNTTPDSVSIGHSSGTVAFAVRCEKVRPYE